MDVSKIYDSLFQSWQVKCTVSFLMSVAGFLIGEINAPFIALWSLIIIDMLTKWVGIAKNLLDERDIDSNILYGIILAWKTGELCSRSMRRMFIGKVFSYLVLIIAANLLMKIIPSVVIFGNDWAKFPGGFIYSFLALTEVMSIIETLIQIGIDALKPLESFFCRKRDEMTGYKEDK